MIEKTLSNFFLYQQNHSYRLKTEMSTDSATVEIGTPEPIQGSNDPIDESSELEHNENNRPTAQRFTQGWIGRWVNLPPEAEIGVMKENQANRAHTANFGQAYVHFNTVAEK